MKKLIVVLLVLVCALSLFSCKRGTDQAPMGEIAETTAADAPFWNYADDAVLNELNATFDAKKARYVKFDVKSTVGKLSGIPKYNNVPVVMNELTIFS